MESVNINGHIAVSFLTFRERQRVEGEKGQVLCITKIGAKWSYTLPTVHFMSAVFYVVFTIINHYNTNFRTCV